MADRDPVLHAHEVIYDFIAAHKSAAIPSLVLTATAWAVEHGGADVIRGTLRNALAMVDDLEAVMKGLMS